MARMARKTEVNECRKCSTFCDRVIKPSTCIAADCPALYHYDDPLSGRRYMGCLHKVFATEIDVELFAEGRRRGRGSGWSSSPGTRANVVLSRSSRPSPSARTASTGA